MYHISRLHHMDAGLQMSGFHATTDDQSMILFGQVFWQNLTTEGMFTACSTVAPAASRGGAARFL